jgi:hypothetical protein
MAFQTADILRQGFRFESTAPPVDTSSPFLPVASLASRQFFQPVDTRSIGIIALRLQGIPGRGPAAVLYPYLQAFYPFADGAREVVYYDLTFNFNEEQGMEAYMPQVEKVIHVLQVYVTNSCSSNVSN